jgi:hypothetical protein
MIFFRLQPRDVSRASVGILFALLLTCLPTATLHAQRPGTAIVFYAQPKVSADLWPDLFQSLDADLAAGEGESPKGLVLDKNATFLRGNDNLPVGIDFSQVIVVKLSGRCDVLPQSPHPSLNGPLGWVWRIHGAIQPFIFVDCSRIAQVLRSPSVGLNTQGRRHQMAQAIAHVVLHEWLHFAAQTASHGREGITKQFLSVNELTAEPENSNLVIASH